VLRSESKAQQDRRRALAQYEEQAMNGQRRKTGAHREKHREAATTNREGRAAMMMREALDTRDLQRLFFVLASLYVALVAIARQKAM
jgi:hypothetical protein